MECKFFEEVLEIKNGRNQKHVENPDGIYPIYGSGGIMGHANSYICDADTVIIGRKGSINKPIFVETPCWNVDTAFGLVAKRDVLHPKYLFYFCKQFDFNKLNTTVTIPSLTKTNLFGIKIPLPPLSEQKRIAAILDKADAIRRKRQQAMELADKAIQSVYVYICGHKNQHYNEWKPYSIEELAAQTKNSIRTGPFGSALKHSEFVDKGIAVLGIDNAVNNFFAWKNRRFITPEKYKMMKRYTVFPGDVIITIMGTTGRSAVVPDDIPLAISTKHLATITPNRTLIHPEFLSNAIYRDSYALRQIAEKNKGAIMPGLNMTLIKEIKLRLPPLHVQEAFAHILQQIRSVQIKMAPQKNIEKLFSSLQQRAFRGEL